jgi:NDP-sugar pyrophosphorylase family protein
MNERIKELAELAGLAYKMSNGKYWIDAGEPDIHLERFAELVRQDERDACIKIVTKNASLETAWKCEEEIRARGNT